MYSLPPTLPPPLPLSLSPRYLKVGWLELHFSSTRLLCLERLHQKEGNPLVGHHRNPLGSDIAAMLHGVL